MSSSGSVTTWVGQLRAGNHAAACPKLAESLRLDASMGTRFYLAECLVVGRPSLDDPYGLFPGGVREGEIDLADLAALLAEGLGDVKAAAFNT